MVISYWFTHQLWTQCQHAAPVARLLAGTRRWLGWPQSWAAIATLLDDGYSVINNLFRGLLMIGISKLYCGAVEASDPLRYGRHSKSLPSHLLQFSSDKKPVVVWNVTRRCNLKCVHCYSQSEDRNYSDELSFEEGTALIDDLAEFGSPGASPLSDAIFLI
jgi:sulfatase maturation enzyme AslB (radical SAM superfamily)